MKELVRSQATGYLVGPEAPTPPPARGERGTTWRHLEAELPVALAELAVLAPGFALVPDGEHAWRHHHEPTDLLVRIACEPDGEGAALGVRIAPMQRQLVLFDPVISPTRPRSYIVYLLLSTAASAALVFAGLPLLSVPVVFTTVALLMLVTSAIFDILGDIARGVALQRARRRFVADWHRRFWPALQARLAERQPYR